MTQRRLLRSLAAGAWIGGCIVAVACGSNSGGPGAEGNTYGTGDSGLVVYDSTSPTDGPGTPDTSSTGDGGSCADAANGATSSCSGLCTNLQTDVKNCGSCGHACSVSGANAACVAGSCACNSDAGSTLCGSVCVDTLTDPNNCGACNHVCQNASAMCSGGTCQATTVASTGQPIWSIVVDPARVWWTQPGDNGAPGDLYRKPFASGSSIDTVEMGLPDPRGMAIDDHNVYWVDYYGASVSQISLVGGSYITDWPVSGDGGAGTQYRQPLAVAVDPVDQMIYWVSYLDNDILGIPIGNPNGDKPTVLAQNQLSPTSIAVDTNNVYWTNYGDADLPPYNGAVLQMPRTGGTIITLASGELNAWAIAVDEQNVYWIDHAQVPNGSVKQVPIGGGKVITLATNEGSPWGLAVDNPTFASPRKVYWTSQDDNTVNGIVIGGGSPKQVYATQQQTPQAITVDQSNVYWANLESGAILSVTK